MNDWNQFKVDYGFFSFPLYAMRFYLSVCVDKHNGLSVGNRCVQCFINISNNFQTGGYCFLDCTDRQSFRRCKVVQPTHRHTHKPDKHRLHVHWKFKQTAVDSFALYVCCKVESGLDWIGLDWYVP